MRRRHMVWRTGTYTTAGARKPTPSSGEFLRGDSGERSGISPRSGKWWGRQGRGTAVEASANERMRQGHLLVQLEASQRVRSRCPSLQGENLVVDQRDGRVEVGRH